uniref:non-specific serine/threonine protein kinase n=1 Tax=Chromera velia CCMP2878 TaxID=1169474 RepID=A0A0G4I7S9_9ALVE|eukprot:Cvel_11673.t1-p1 / transcript=Cvel_11673.t1 / gene=Cvel_11673 / organism=Chromera_velia_CCMP2878 / gene_product=hypothetical protein / transcript_product=hypothetical protein / location=Cvel_scaffold740:12870-17232(-) / protein_length=1040 / sequence_SO=supercontig / SO=protein_coding / is_pseudo=false
MKIRVISSFVLICFGTIYLHEHECGELGEGPNESEPHLVGMRIVSQAEGPEMSMRVFRVTSGGENESPSAEGDMREEGGESVMLLSPFFNPFGASPFHHFHSFASRMVPSGLGLLPVLGALSRLRHMFHSNHSHSEPLLQEQERPGVTEDDPGSFHLTSMDILIFDGETLQSSEVCTEVCVPKRHAAAMLRETAAVELGVCPEIDFRHHTGHLSIVVPQRPNDIQSGSVSSLISALPGAPHVERKDVQVSFLGTRSQVFNGLPSVFEGEGGEGLGGDRHLAGMRIVSQAEGPEMSMRVFRVTSGGENEKPSAEGNMREEGGETLATSSTVVKPFRSALKGGVRKEGKRKEGAEQGGAKGTGFRSVISFSISPLLEEFHFSGLCLACVFVICTFCVLAKRVLVRNVWSDAKEESIYQRDDHGDGESPLSSSASASFAQRISPSVSNSSLCDVCEEDFEVPVRPDACSLITVGIHEAEMSGESDEQDEVNDDPTMSSHAPAAPFAAAAVTPAVPAAAAGAAPASSSNVQGKTFGSKSSMPDWFDDRLKKKLANRMHVDMNVCEMVGKGSFGSVFRVLRRKPGESTQVCGLKVFFEDEDGVFDKESDRLEEFGTVFGVKYLDRMSDRMVEGHKYKRVGFLLMDFLPGGSLEEFFRKKTATQGAEWTHDLYVSQMYQFSQQKHDVSEFEMLFLALFKRLAEMKVNMTYHGDIKASNFVLNEENGKISSENVLCLVDACAAQSLLPGKKPEMYDDEVYAYMTPIYLSPDLIAFTARWRIHEAFEGRVHDDQSDVTGVNHNDVISFDSEEEAYEDWCRSYFELNSDEQIPEWLLQIDTIDQATLFEKADVYAAGVMLFVHTLPQMHPSRKPADGRSVREWQFDNVQEVKKCLDVLTLLKSVWKSQNGIEYNGKDFTLPLLVTQMLTPNPWHRPPASILLSFLRRALAQRTSARIQAAEEKEARRKKEEERRNSLTYMNSTASSRGKQKNGDKQADTKTAAPVIRKVDVNARFLKGTFAERKRLERIAEENEARKKRAGKKVESFRF